jgi:hypothetical protein
MKSRAGIVVLIISILVLLVFSGCAPRRAVVVTEVGTGVVYVGKAPPAARVEVRPASPTAGAVWIPGHHRWNGRRYVWVGGHWDRNPRGSTWVPGRWVHGSHGWRWIHGHWR